MVVSKCWRFQEQQAHPGRACRLLALFCRCSFAFFTTALLCCGQQHSHSPSRPCLAKWKWVVLYPAFKSTASRSLIIIL